MVKTAEPEAPRLITDFVPPMLRNKADDPETIKALLPYYVQHLPFEEAYWFIQGAVEHQNRVANEEENSWFPAELVRIEDVERKAGSRLLGIKKRLVFEAKGYKTKDITEQSIDTDWVEYHGFDKDQWCWEMALARTIAEIAEENVGKKVYIQKFLFKSDDKEGGSVALRSALNIKPDFSKEDEDEPKSRKAGAKKDGDRPRGRKGKSEVEQAVDDRDPDEVLADKDVEFLEDLMADDPTRDKILEEIADYLKMDEDDMDEPKRARSLSDAEYAVDLMVLNIGD